MLSEYLATITSHPTRIKRFTYLVIPTWGSTSPRLLTRFCFVPRDDCFVPLGSANLTIRPPGSYRYYFGIRRGLALMKSGSKDMSRFFVGHFSRHLFYHRNSLLAPVSTHNSSLIAPCSQLKPPKTEFGHCGQVRSQA